MCWSWSTQGENVFWKSGVKSEFLLLKSTLLSGQQIITKWVAPPSNKVKPKFIKTKCFKCHSAWITVPISPPTHADCSCFKRFSASLQAQHAHPERKQPPILDTNQRNICALSCASDSLPSSCQPGAWLSLAYFRQLPLQLCGLHRLHLCSDLAVWFWSFSPYGDLPKRVVFVIFQVAIKMRVEVKVTLHHKSLKSFFACYVKQIQETTAILTRSNPSLLWTPPNPVESLEVECGHLHDY